MFKTPESLTKDRLKAELRKRGVSFEPHEYKDYYVQLYRKEVLKSKSPGRSRVYRGELSSDEEFVARQSPRQALRRRQQQASPHRKKAAVLDTYLDEVAQLSDAELASELKLYGQTPGPITDTTRTTYQRILAKRMAEKAKVSSRARDEADYGSSTLGKADDWSLEWSSEEGEEGEGEEEEEEEEEEESRPVKINKEVKLSPDKRYIYQTYSTPSHTYVESTYLREKSAPEEERRQQRDKPSSRPRAHGGKPQQPKPKVAPTTPPSSTRDGWSSFLGSLLLLLVVFVIAFLAFNYYSSPEDSILAGLWLTASDYYANLTKPAEAT